MERALLRHTIPREWSPRNWTLTCWTAAEATSVLRRPSPETEVGDQTHPGMKSHTLILLVLCFQLFCCRKCGTEPITCCSGQNQRTKRDTQNKVEDLATALNVDDLNIPQPPSVLDNLIQNGLLPSEITQQLERILKNFTEIIRRANYTVEVQTEAVSNDSLEFSLVAENFKKQYPLDLWKKHGWFEDDYLRLINVHWLKFPPTPKAAHYALAFIYSTVAVCGFFGNALVIFMFFKWVL